MNRFSFLVLVFLLVMPVLVCGCADDDNDDDGEPTYDDYVADGKSFLTDNDAAHAARAFDAALALRPESVDARVGLVMAGPMRLFNFVDQIITTISEITFSVDRDPDKEGAAVEQELHPIHLYLVEKLGDLVTQSETSYDELAGEAIDFELELYPLEAADVPLLTMSGVFDETDLDVVAAANALVHGGIELLLAYNMEFDYNAIGVPLSDGEMHIIETLELVMGILDGVINSELYPNFLQLLEDGGAAHLANSGISLGNAFARMGSALDRLAAETGPQDDAPIAFDDANGNGRWDVDTEDVFFGEYRLDPSVVAAIRELAETMAPVFYEGSPLDPNPDVEDLLYLSDLNAILEALGVLPLDLGGLVIEGLPAGPGINVGLFFYEPEPDALRDLLSLLIDIWYNPGELF